MPVKTFILKTEAQTIRRKDWELADRTLLKASNANPLVMGEWCQVDANNRMVRGDGTIPGFVIWSETGRTDTQAIGQAPLLFLGSYLADTLIFNTSSSPALGAALEVATVTYDSKSKSGLQTQSSGLTVGYVMRTSASNGGYLQFIQTQA